MFTFPLKSYKPFTMGKKPKQQEVIEAKETLKRWYFVAKERGKTSAMHETKKIYDLLVYLEDVTDFNIKE